MYGILVRTFSAGLKTYTKLTTSAHAWGGSETSADSEACFLAKLLLECGVDNGRERICGLSWFGLSDGTGHVFLINTKFIHQMTDDKIDKRENVRDSFQNPDRDISNKHAQGFKD